MIGGNGPDVLDGGIGNDVLIGKAASDTYVFGNDWGADEIIEEAGADRNSADFRPTTSPVMFDVTHSLAPTSIDAESGSRTYAQPFATSGSNTVSGAYLNQFVGGTNVDTFHVPFAISEGLPNTWNITESNGGNVNNRYFFGGMESLIAHEGDDLFQFHGGALINGSIDGLGASDELNFATFDAMAPIQMDRQEMRVSRLGTAGGFTYANIESMVGGPSNDDLLITDNGGETVQVTGNNAGHIGSPETFSFTSIENLGGGTGDDQFLFAEDAAVSGSIDGSIKSATPDNDWIDMSAATSSLTFSITDRNAGTVSNARLLADFLNVENLRGGTSSDQFVVTPLKELTGEIDGHLGLADQLDYSAWVVPVTANLQTQTASGLGSVTNVEYILGGIAGDNLTGNAAANRLIGNQGNDFLYGLAGNDLLIGGVGDDTLEGGEENDILWGGLELISSINLDQADPSNFELPPMYLASEAQYPTGYFPSVLVTPVAVSGSSLAGVTRGGRDNLKGEAGFDLLFGGFDIDILDGGDGPDYVDGGHGNDNVMGGDGDDVVRGGLNDDAVDGGGGIDQVLGEKGADSLFGGGSVPHAPGQRLYGGEGRDILNAFSSSVVAAAGLPGDQLFGGPGGDQLNGNLGDDLLVGEAGNDLLRGDILAGPLYVTNTAAATTGGKDWLIGGAGEDELRGGGGDDELWGGVESDLLDGQAGSDKQYGGSGIDLFVAPTATGQNVGIDSIDGHFGNAQVGDTPDDNATDILVVDGTTADDSILFAETIPVAPSNFGQLHIDYNAQDIIVEWRDPMSGNFLVEQIQVAGLAGNDTIGFAQTVPHVGLNIGLPTNTQQLDLAPLAARSNDFIGVFDGNTGNDILIGSAGRDRLDGGIGSDTSYGFAGDDRLWGDTGIASSGDHDTMFAGGGNDDLIGGAGTNSLYAWSLHPQPTPDTQFGIFVDEAGNLFDDDGDLDDDGQLDSDPSLPPRLQEGTGLNRLLGMSRADNLFGGTSLDFMHGNGGDDTLFRADGSTFESLDGGVAGDAWKEYARSTGQVWYLGGTNADDEITVDFVTEPGLLSDHHLVTRLTENNGHFSFAAQVRLDFAATDDDGNAIWEPTDSVFHAQAYFEAVGDPESTPSTQALAETQLVDGLLPAEGDFLAIIIDAFDGNDEVEVGPTVQKTVWIDAGPGDDIVDIRSGNSILVDQAELGDPAGELRTRNDFSSQAYPLLIPSAPTAFTNLSIDSPQDVDWYRLDLPEESAGLTIDVGSSSPADDMLLQVFQVIDGQDPIELTPIPSVWESDQQYLLRVANQTMTPTNYDLAFSVGVGPLQLVDMSLRTDSVRRDVILGGLGDDILSGGAGEDWIFGGPGQDVLTGGLDRQSSDLLFAGPGDDTFQIIPDDLPELGSQATTLFQPGSETYIPTYSDQMLGGIGTDRVLFLGGDLDRLGNPVSDYAALRYNRFLHRYEFTSLKWDIGNQDFATTTESGRTVYEQQYLFYQVRDVEQTVFDLQRGDDTFHADPGFQFLPMPEPPAEEAELFETWGIDLGDYEQQATIAKLDIRGGGGNDSLFGGVLADTIDGGAGEDLIVGGLGDDEIFGGAANDTLYGGVPTGVDDAYPFVSSYNGLPVDSEFFEFELAAPQFAESSATVTANIDLTQTKQAAFDDAPGVYGTTAGQQLDDVRRIGDLDGDGFDDYLFVGEDNSYVFFRPRSLTSLETIEAAADIIIDHSALGVPSQTFGDVNGDDLADLAFVQSTPEGSTVTVVFGADIDWPRNWNATFASSLADSSAIESTVVTLDPTEFSNEDLSVDILRYDENDLADLLISSGGSTSAGPAQWIAEADIDLQFGSHVYGETPSQQDVLYFSINDQLHRISTDGTIRSLASSSGESVTKPRHYHLTNGVPRVVSSPSRDNAWQVFQINDSRLRDIRNLSAEASSEFGEELAIYAADGSGLNLSSNEHDSGGDFGPFTWLSDPADISPTITFDLGDLYSLDEFELFNYDETGLAHLGVKNVNVFVAGRDLVFQPVAISSNEFTPAASPNVAQSRDFTDDIVARYVRFEISSNQAGGDHVQASVGLGEVLFRGSPVAPIPRTSPSVSVSQNTRVPGEFADANGLYYFVNSSGQVVRIATSTGSTGSSETIINSSSNARHLTEVTFGAGNGNEDEAVYSIRALGSSTEIRLLPDHGDDSDAELVSLTIGSEHVDDPDQLLSHGDSMYLTGFETGGSHSNRHIYRTTAVSNSLLNWTVMQLTPSLGFDLDPANLFIDSAGRVFFGVNGSNCFETDCDRELGLVQTDGQFRRFDINLGDGSSNPSNFFEYEGEVYFTVEHDDHLWRHDGENVLQTVITDGDQNELTGLIPFADFNDALYLFHDATNELWSFNGPRPSNIVVSGDRLVPGISDDLADERILEIFPSNAQSDQFSNMDSVVLGDVNGDGLDDILLRDHDLVTTEAADGFLMLLFGGQTRSVVQIGSTNDFYGNGDATAGDIVPLGDLNSDGYDDFSLTNVNETRIYYGATDLSSASFDSPDITISGAGLSVTAGDYNEDGLVDLAVSESSSGEVHVFWSISAQPSDLTLLESNLVLDNPQNGPIRLSDANLDLNGDRIHDLLIASPEFGTIGNTDADLGKVQIIYGAPDRRFDVTAQGTLTASSTETASDVTNLADQRQDSHWFSDGVGGSEGDSGADSEKVTWESPELIQFSRVQLEPETESNLDPDATGGFGFRSVQLRIFDSGTLVHESELISLDQQRVELNYDLPNATFGDTVEIELIGHENSSVGDSKGGFSELRIFAAPSANLLSNVSVPGSGEFLVDNNDGLPERFGNLEEPFKTDSQIGEWHQFTTLGDGKGGNTIRIIPNREATTALDFDGVEDRVQVVNFPSVASDSGAISLSAWVYVEDINTDGNSQERQPIIAKGASGEWEFALYIHDDLSPSISIWQPNGSGHASARGGKLELGKWHHVTGTYLKDADTNIYLDGVLQAQSDSQTGVAGSADTPLLIGGRSDEQFLDAVIDDAQIWSRALHSGEILQLASSMQATVTDSSGLVGRWQFNEGSGTSASDSSGNGFDATLDGGINGSLPTWVNPSVRVAADLYDSRGTLLQRDGADFDMRTLEAGQYLIHVRGPVPYQIEIQAPPAGQTRGGDLPDRDTIHGQDGDDTLTGNEDLDSLFGDSGFDSFVGAEIEVRDAEVSELLPAGDATTVFPIDPDPVVEIPDPSLLATIAEVLGLPVTTSHDGQPLIHNDLRATHLAMVESLDLSFSSVALIESYEGLERLVNLKTLNVSDQSLDLSDFQPRIDTSHSCPAPVGLQHLEWLNLENSHLEADNIASLVGMNSLRYLNLIGTGVPANSETIPQLDSLETLLMSVPNITATDQNFVVLEGDTFAPVIQDAINQPWTAVYADTGETLASGTGQISFAPSRPGAILVNHGTAGENGSAGEFYVLVRNGAPVISRPLNVIQVNEGETFDADELASLAGVAVSDPGAGDLITATWVSNEQGQNMSLTDTALDFNGTSDRVRIDNFPSVVAENQHLTLSTWVNVQSVNTDANGQDRQPILVKGASGEWEFGLFVEDDLQVSVNLWQADGSTHSFATGGSLELGSWHHITGTYERNGETRIYVDGQLVDSVNTPTGTPESGTSPLYIGGRSDGQFLDAIIDDPLIANRALSELEIQELLEGNFFVDPTHLVGYWPLDETSGNEVLDASGNGHHGTRKGGTSESVPIRVLGNSSPRFHADDEGEWTVTFTADDGFGGTDTASTPLIVTNLPPTAIFTIPAAGEVGVPLVLDGASSFDPGPTDMLTYEWSFGGTVDSTLTLPHAVTSFTPTSSGTHTVTLTVTDPAGQSDTHELNYEVNAPPIAVDDQYETDEFMRVVTTAIRGPLSNDSDPENAGLFLVSFDTVSELGASVSFSEIDSGRAALTYEAINGSSLRQLPPGETVTDTFEYILSDGSLESTATITVIVVGVNDAPTGQFDAATTDEETSILVDVLSNDSDIDGDDSSMTLTSVGPIELFYDDEFHFAESAFVEIRDNQLFFDPADELIGLVEGESAIVDIGYGFVDDEGAYGSSNLTVTVAGLSRPSVKSVVVNEGGESRSMVTALTVTFDQEVAVGLLRDAFTLTNTTNAEDVETVHVAAKYREGTTVATLTFAGEDIVGDSLADGNYLLSIDSTKVSNGLELSEDHVDTFFRRFGDANGDGLVGIGDFGAFRSAFAQEGTPEARDFDYDGDGAVGIDDFGQFRNRFGKPLL